MDYTTGLLIGILVLVFLSLFTRGGGGDLSARIRAVDRKLDLILANLGIEPNQGLDKQLSDLVRSGQKIEAVKLCRAQMGLGLKEAKDYVERL